MGNKFVSRVMGNHETPVVYSATYSMNIEDCSHFTISCSESQGFFWNQDLFASQYQQMCKVVYDGHEDTFDKLLKDIESQGQANHDTEHVRAQQHQFLKQRRKSEKCVSFTSDLKNGLYNRNDAITIDVESDSDENDHFKWLTS